MKLSHILYKVNDLNNGVNYFKNKGFNVEFGSRYQPHNALIYFSEGPYIEIIQNAPISRFLKFILILIGKRKLVNRFNSWDTSKDGFFEICLENKKNNLKSEIEILKKNNQKFFVTSSKRHDPFGRLLKWRLLFPMENKIPFMMTYFNIDPKPKNYIHPNGVSRIERVIYGTEKKFIPILKKLCNDKVLIIEPGLGVKSISYNH